MIKLNIGCCDLPMPKPWINIDNSTSPHIKADLLMDGLTLDEEFSPASVDEIYAGHFIEHLYPEEVEKFVSMCFTLLKPGGKIALVTPDFRYIVNEYLKDNPAFQIPHLIHTYIFSYEQESHHRTIWDINTMIKLLTAHGFHSIIEIDRNNDPRVAYPCIWQVGVEGTK